MVGFEYPNIDKSLFQSAAIDATYNVTSTLRQLHAIVGDYNGEGYPLGMFLVQKKTFG